MAPVLLPVLIQANGVTAMQAMYGSHKQSPSRSVLHYRRHKLSWLSYSTRLSVLSMQAMCVADLTKVSAGLFCTKVGTTPLAVLNMTE